MTTQVTPIGAEPLEEAFVTRVEIRDLYGLYSYSLGDTQPVSTDARRLFLLYGDNGAGKTTVLRLIFSLLSQARDQGHRGYLARTPFRRLSVRLGAATDFVVEKLGDALVGSYRIRVTTHGTEVFAATLQADEDQRVKRDTPGLQDYLKLLTDLGVALYYLSDDRKSRSSAEDGRDVHEERLVYQLQQEELVRTGRRPPLNDLQLGQEQVLELAIGRFVGWVRSQALSGSSVGEVNTNKMYADIVRRIAKPPRRGRPASNERDLPTLLAALSHLEEQNRRYAEFGLTTRLAVEPIVSAATAAPAPTRRIIAGVLGPYVDGLRARLNALKEVAELLAVFVDSVNSFLYNKSVAFDLRTGLLIRSRNGDVLPPRALSSGERQLLLLLCNTVLARDNASIFIIDEPEISLNIKWQRKLLDSLLRLTTDSPVQFIIATHSLELLARHKGAVRRLAEHTPEAQ